MRIKIIFLLFFTFNFYSVISKKAKAIISVGFASIPYFLFKEIKNKINLNDTSVDRFKKILKNNSFEYNDFYEKILENLNRKGFFDDKKDLLNLPINTVYKDLSKGIYDKDKKAEEACSSLKKYFKFLDKVKFEFSDLEIQEIEKLIYSNEKDEKKELIKENFLSKCFPCYFKINKSFKIDEEYYKKRVKSIKENKFLFGYFSDYKNNNKELINAFDKVILKFVIKNVLNNPEEKIINDVFQFLLSVQKKRNKEYLKIFKETYGKNFENNSYKNFYNFFLKRKNLTIFGLSIICFLLRNKVKSPIEILSNKIISSEKVLQNNRGKLFFFGVVAGILINKSNILSELKNGNLIQIVLGAFI